MTNNVFGYIEECKNFDSAISTLEKLCDDSQLNLARQL